MRDTQPHRPTSLQKLLFWAILGALSVFFAEASLGASPFVFFDAWGLLVVYPLYLLHLLVLARIVFWHERPRFAALFFAGVLLGLYEAYMTKQIWNPDWNPAAIRVGGVAVIETIVLILWWHPVMALIMPLLVAETALCRSRLVARALPLRLRRALFGRRSRTVLLVLGVPMGLLFSIAPKGRSSTALVVLSAVGALGVVLALAWLWRRATRGTRMSLPELLPTNRQMVLLCIGLGLMYVGLGIALRPECLPGPGPQASVWLLYGVFIGGLWQSLRRPRPASAFELLEPPDRFSWRLWISLAAVIVVTAAASSLALGQKTAAYLLVDLVVGAVIGVAALLMCIRDILRRGPTPVRL
jgi:hypothetical protein